MKNKIPPPIWLLLFAIAMWFVAHSPVGYRVAIPYALVPAFLLGFVGLYVATLAMLQFNRANTTVNPLSPEEASSLVTSGVFERTRNPMYVGLLFILTGWAVWLGSPTNLAMLVLFVVTLTQLQIKPEEAAMRALFGQAFDDYCQRVRRWV